jgi:hypothetical protein
MDDLNRGEQRGLAAEGFDTAGQGAKSKDYGVVEADLKADGRGV